MRLKSFQPFLIGGFFIALPLLLRQVDSSYASPLTDATLPLPFLIMAVLGFLSIKVNQTRLLFTALTMVVVYSAVLFLPGKTGLTLSFPWMVRITAIALPLSLLVIQWTPEGRLRGGYGASLIGATLAPTLILTGLFQYGGKPIAQWLALHPSFSQIPTLAWAGWILFAAFSFVHGRRSRARVHRFIAVAVLPLFLALEPVLSPPLGPNVRFILAIGFVCAGAILHYGIFLLYWERVYIDELTGIPNRRALDERLLQLGSGYSVAMIDIDHFKKFNDTYGHENGDMVLKYVATHVFSESKGRAYRYGGEEFTVVMAGVKRDVATGEMDAIRESLSRKRFSLRSGDRKKGPVGGEQVQVTISIGVASCTDPDQPPENVMKVADQALYEAKGRGRDCVVMAVGEAVKKRA